MESVERVESADFKRLYDEAKKTLSSIKDTPSKGKKINDLDIKVNAGISSYINRAQSVRKTNNLPPLTEEQINFYRGLVNSAFDEYKAQSGQQDATTASQGEPAPEDVLDDIEKKKRKRRSVR